MNNRSNYYFQLWHGCSTTTSCDIYVMRSELVAVNKRMNGLHDDDDDRGLVGDGPCRGSQKNGEG